jgi:hypothetical protein
MWDVMGRIEDTVWGQLRISGKGGGYFENMWLWVADHVFDTGPSRLFFIASAAHFASPLLPEFWWLNFSFGVFMFACR